MIGTEVLLHGGLAWPESPRVHDGSLWFSDVHHFRVVRLAPDGTVANVAHVPGRPAGLGFMPDGRLLVAGALDRKLWWVGPDGGLTLAADLSPLARGLLNDMIVDGQGRAWVGDTGFDLLKGEPEAPGRLISWRPGVEARVAVESVRFPNGLAMSPDHRSLFLAETFGECVTALQLSPDGTVVGRATHARLAARPDGLCLDSEGGLWVALLWDGKFRYIDPSGLAREEIVLDGERAISCVLAGEDRRELVMGTAHMDETDKANPRRDGRLRRCRVALAGAGIP
ncbi:SMP-30/gluconolactonase/LRE family protein [Ramlibacter sp.]|uniref:SMP-30/gluconolactonase/LRE family protein n=1 Tax=Ramlibacter sp. TaxID=1917967 RepID=UPI003D0F31AC